MNFIPKTTLAKLRATYKTNPVDALIAAGIAILENAGWCRDVEAKTTHHKYLKGDHRALGIKDEVEHPQAGSFCAIGALRRGQYELTGKSVSSSAFKKAIKRLDTVVKNTTDESDIVTYNDKSAKSKTAVIKKFDAALATK
jgi:hypothetical protein